MYHIFIIHSLADEHPGCLQCQAIMYRVNGHGWVSTSVVGYRAKYIERTCVKSGVGGSWFI